ncbi:peptide chain release factor N(5)-glutamine methyltransferase [Marinomonas posidonica]|uniref:Release factor glutamine methyltransferase n=1 Tax=Marinomonas posidonica (strain CECT 7376 / NCIMB 14433 / IVIA-Po-181) TaxID=491952 RepID=F6CRJ8_MARPP|nr:peptide chain release factor N(5)-glutamine methyltransferase [Marinomonas posidonica]AEF53761.1 protein-(glutamine-N5) methyltransferase, release factor-specific [Marinomonas posidonica IVIA-Po-181]
MRIDESLQGASERLRFMSDTALLDAQLLLAQVLNVSTSYFYSWPERVLTNDELSSYDALLTRREKGEPIAYILGKQAFWTLDLEVAPCTLIPRADTECLVEAALSILHVTKGKKILDLGTGTGAIALALATECRDSKVLGVDLIADAVALAKRNAASHQISNAHFMQSCWFEQLSELGMFDLIVSNPPYIDPEDHHLSEGDVRFEPKTALVAENHGLADIERIIEQAPNFLKQGGYLMFEHGYDQAEAVRRLLTLSGFSEVRSIQDFGGNDRVTMGCLSNSDHL